MRQKTLSKKQVLKEQTSKDQMSKDQMSKDRISKGKISKKQIPNPKISKKRLPQAQASPKTQNKKILIINMVATFAMLVYAVLTGLSLQYPLGVSFVLFVLYAKTVGYSIKQIWQMVRTGIHKSMTVVSVMLIIGMLTASWFISGTIPMLVCLGIQVITPKMFLLCTFLICAAVSVTIGTSFGTVNTLGVVLMVIARGSGVSPAMTAGAIVSGIFMGDRCSPMSSSLMLLSSMTKTELFDNSKMCFRTIAVPTIVSVILYGILSVFHPMTGSSGTMASEVGESFVLTPWLLVPIFIIFGMCLKRISIKITMSCSIAAAVILALVIQKERFSTILHSLLLGFSLPEGAPSAEIMHGGGLVSMAVTCIVVLLSCMITEILEGTHSLDAFMGKTEEADAFRRYLKTLGAGIAAAAIGCNQTVGIIMTAALREKAYGEDRRGFAQDVSIAGSIIPVMIPWCIAVYTPIQTLDFEGIGYYPFMFLMIALILWGGVLAFFEKSAMINRKEKITGGIKHGT